VGNFSRILADFVKKRFKRDIGTVQIGKKLYLFCEQELLF